MESGGKFGGVVFKDEPASLFLFADEGVAGGHADELLLALEGEDVFTGLDMDVLVLAHFTGLEFHMHVFQLEEVLEVAFDLMMTFTQLLGKGAPKQAVHVVAADDGAHAVAIDAEGPVVDKVGQIFLLGGIVADGAETQAAYLLVLVNEHGVCAARIDIFSKFMSKFFQDVDQRDVVVAEDDKVDEQVHHEHDDQGFHDALGVGQDAAKQGQQQRIHPVGRDMHQSGDHPPTGKNHQHRECEVGQVSQ